MKQRISYTHQLTKDKTKERNRFSIKASNNQIYVKSIEKFIYAIIAQDLTIMVSKLLI